MVFICGVCVYMFQYTHALCMYVCVSMHKSMLVAQPLTCQGLLLHRTAKCILNEVMVFGYFCDFTLTIHSEQIRERVCGKESI